MTFQESETVELKAVVVEDIKKEIIAFANCEGGKMIGNGLIVQEGKGKNTHYCLPK